MTLLRHLGHRYPFNYPRAWLLRRMPGVPADSQKVKARFGVVFTACAPGHDPVSKSIFWMGDFDPWIVRTMLRLTRKDDVVCDIGANIGDTALPLARHIGPNGRVHCFEPLLENVTRLKHNIQANAFTNVIVHAQAVSDEPGEVIIGVPTGKPGQAQVVDHEAAEKGLAVQTVVFDLWRQENAIASVAVCKVDVEGHELKVLRGMTATLEAGAIGALIFEQHGGWDPACELANFLGARGYHIYHIRKHLLSQTYVDPLQSGGGRATTDYVAVRRGSEYEHRLLH